MLQPPVAPKRPVEVGQKRIDPYYYLRDDSRQNPEILQHLEAENQYLAEQMAPVKGLQEQLYQEMIGRIKQDDSSVPVLDRGFWYRSRYETGAEYAVIERWSAATGTRDQPGEVETLLDIPTRAAGCSFYQVGGWGISPDNRMLAWAEDTVGRRQFVIRFRDLQTQQDLPDQIPGCSASFTWASNRTLVLVENDPDTLRTRWIRRHTLGETERPLLYEEADETFYIGVGKTTSRQFLILQSSSTVTSEVRYARCGDAPEFAVLLPRSRDHEYEADHLQLPGQPGRWIVRSNQGGPNFALFQAPEADPSQWAPLLPHQSQVLIEGFLPLHHGLAVEERAEALVKIRVFAWTEQGIDLDNPRQIAAQDPAYTMHMGSNLDPSLPTLRYAYASLTTPDSVMELDLSTGQSTLLKRTPVLGDFDPAHYTSARLWAPSHDGTLVPISLIRHKNTPLDGSAALLLYGYGAYGHSMDATFSSVRLSWLDRGGIYAIAHVRGGQEQGRAWYDGGRMANKANSFKDFVACADYLAAQGYAHPERLGAMGGSAGGLLMGASVNLRPDRFRAVVAQVPFVDVLTTMEDTSLPLTTNEYDEWGNPTIPEQYTWIAEYSPYDNIQAVPYPAMLVTTGLHDSQVQYFEPAKWVQKLRDTTTGPNPILFHCELVAGHGGKSGRFQRYHEIAREYAFLIWQLGLL